MSTVIAPTTAEVLPRRVVRPLLVFINSALIDRGVVLHHHRMHIKAAEAQGSFRTH